MRLFRKWSAGEGNDHSIDPSVSGRMVDVSADFDRVKVRAGGRIVADHARRWARRGTVTDPAHVEVAARLRRQFRQPRLAASGDDLSDQLSARIGKVTGTLLSTQIKAIAETQLAELLTPEIYQRIEELSRRRLAAELETQLVAEAQAAEEAENPPTTVFGSTEEFVRVRLAPGYRRDVVDNREIRWCPQWWRHEEAISRLEALWRTWEHFRRDPTTGMSVWWRDHADHHMSVLMSSDGPFSRCSAAHGHHTADNAIAPLPTDPAPAGMFPDTREL